MEGWKTVRGTYFQGRNVCFREGNRNNLGCQGGQKMWLCNPKQVKGQMAAEKATNQVIPQPGRKLPTIKEVSKPSSGAICFHSRLQGINPTFSWGTLGNDRGHECWNPLLDTAPPPKNPICSQLVRESFKRWESFSSLKLLIKNAIPFLV